MADYVDNKDLHRRIKDWLQRDPEGEQMPEDIGRDVMLIANGMMNHWRFIGYTDDWKEEFVGKAIINCIKYMKNYKWWIYKNPHAYISMIVSRTSRPLIKKFKNRNAAHVRMVVDKLEEVKLDERFADIDQEIMDDLYRKVEQVPELDKEPTQEEKVSEWNSEMVNLFEMELDEKDFEDDE